MLLVVFVSVLAPFIKVDVTNRWTENTIIDIDERLINAVTIAPITQAEQVEYIPVITESAPVKAPINYQILVYKIGLLVFASILLIQLSRLAILIITGKKYYQDRLMIIEHQSVKAPSSFLFTILLPNDHSLTEREKEIVIEHERQHIQQRHSLDLLAISLFQILTWYNPFLFWIRSEFKNIHETLADKATLETVGNKEYFQLLLASAFSTKSISLSHCFGQKKGLLKRIQLIKKQRTTMKRTAISLAIFSFIAFSAIGINILNGQDNNAQSKGSKSLNDKTVNQIRAEQRENINRIAKQEGFPEVGSREEALEFFKRNRTSNIGSYAYSRKLTNRFEQKLERLKKIYPEKEIRHTYIKDPASSEYRRNAVSTTLPLYVGKLNDEDKGELVELSLKDTTRMKAMSYGSQTYPVYFFSINELLEEFKESIRNSTNYILFYERIENKDITIYEESDVDEKPEPIGGLKAFERAIALDTELPENIIKESLPEYIDFEAVIYGGNQMNSVNLVTKIKGKDKKNDDLYKLYGTLIKQIQDKTLKFYYWKTGKKDGKNVRVRMKISIPTKYMM